MCSTILKRRSRDSLSVYIDFRAQEGRRYEHKFWRYLFSKISFPSASSSTSYRRWWCAFGREPQGLLAKLLTGDRSEPPYFDKKDTVLLYSGSYTSGIWPPAAAFHTIVTEVLPRILCSYSTSCRKKPGFGRIIWRRDCKNEKHNFHEYKNLS